MRFLILLTAVFSGILVSASPLDFKHVVGQPTHGPALDPHLAPSGDYRNDDVMHDYTAGGPHGDVKFNDEKFIGNLHNRIGQIWMWCDPKGGQMQAISFKYRDNMHAFNDPEAISGGDVHGSNQVEAWKHVFKLDLGEYIKTMDIWTYKARGHTRIGSISFTSNNRKDFASCGPKTGNKVTWGGDGQALSFVSGTSGKVVDFMHGYFIAAGAF